MPPPFTLESRVSVSDAKQDKVEFTLGRWRFRSGSLADYQGLIRRLNAHERIDSWGQGIIEPPRQVVGDSSRNQFRFVKRTSRGVIQSNRPLFENKIAITRDGLIANLSASVTRFVRHQTLPRQGANWGPIRLGSSPLTPADLSSNNECPIVPNADNLLCPISYEQFGNSENWRRHRLRFWNGIVTFFQEALQAPGVDFRPSFNVASIENYWEFEVDDPIDTVISMTPVLIGRADASDELHIIRTNDRNSPCTRARIAPGITLKVYAKTTRRIRIEVEQKLKECQNRLYVPHTFSDQSLFFPLVEDTAAIAQEIVNEFLSDLQRAWNAIGVHYGVSHYLFQLNRLVSDPNSAQAIFQLLVNGGGFVRIGNEITPLDEYLIVMKNRGLLVRLRPRLPDHSVPQAYLAAFRQLAQSTVPDTYVQPVARPRRRRRGYSIDEII